MPSYTREPGQLAQHRHPSPQSVTRWLAVPEKVLQAPEMLLILLTLAVNLVPGDHWVLDSN